MATSIMGNWYSSTGTVPHTYITTKASPVTKGLSIPTKLATCLKPTWNDYYSPEGQYNQL